MLKTAEIAIGEFLLPWGMVISALGFVAAWIVIFVLERLRLTRFLWNLPLLFIALSVLLGSVFGILLAP
jgi:hypothetical protein